MNKEELLSHLRKNKGYTKWGVERIQERFANGLSLDTIKDVRDQAKEKAKKDKTAYKKFLEEEGLTDDQVSSYTVWDTPNGRRVSAKVKNNSFEINDLVNSFSEKLSNITTPSITQPKKEKKQKIEKCGVLGLHDAHIDKVVLASETGYDTDATIEDNVDQYEQYTMSLMKEAYDEGITTLFFPVGSDFWTVNDDRNTTKRGTKQRVIVPFQKSFEVGVEVIIRLLRWAAEHFKNVEVPVVYGNHDEDLDFFLGMVLNQAFRNVEHVHINYDRVERKYYQFHMNGFMFAHGYHAKSKRQLRSLPSNFSEDTEESARIWYETRGGQRKVFLGDIHHEKGYEFLRNNDGIGLSVQFMRGVGNTGKYEWDNGWTGVPKTAYLWIYEKSGLTEEVKKKVWR